MKRKQAVLSLKRYRQRFSGKNLKVFFSAAFFVTPEPKPNPQAQFLHHHVKFPSHAPPCSREHKLLLPMTQHPQVLLTPFCTGFWYIPPAPATPPLLAIRKWNLGVCLLLPQQSRRETSRLLVSLNRQCCSSHWPREMAETTDQARNDAMEHTHRQKQADKLLVEVI